MKHTSKILLGSLILIGLEFGWTGCVGPGDGDVGVVYGGGPWFSDGVWVDGGGRGWYGGHRDAAYAHPVRGGGHPAPRGGGHPAPSGGGHAAPSGGGGHGGGGGEHR
jgi:hypothetical protein